MLKYRNNFIISSIAIFSIVTGVMSQSYKCSAIVAPYVEIQDCKVLLSKQNDKPLPQVESVDYDSPRSISLSLKTDGEFISFRVFFLGGVSAPQDFYSVDEIRGSIVESLQSASLSFLYLQSKWVLLGRVLPPFFGIGIELVPASLEIEGENPFNLVLNFCVIPEANTAFEFSLNFNSIRELYELFQTTNQTDREVAFTFRFYVLEVVFNF